jgi:DHA3 family macrolide efflux protein-like MFS transporter
VHARAQSMQPFLIVWTGQAFSLLGSQLVQFALVWWLTATTGSATVLALASMMAVLPQVFIGPFAGVLVDRWRRRMVMMGADAAIALATVMLAALYALGIVQVWHIYSLMLLRAVGGAFHWPAMQASTTLMVPQQHLSHVAGLNQTLFGLAGIFVPPLGALAFEALPMQSILAIDVGTALLAIVPLLFIPIPQPTRRKAGIVQAGPSVLDDMREGLRFVWGWKAALVFSCIGMLSSMLGGAAASLRPILVIDHFAGGALELAWLQSAVGVGSVLGGVALGVWGGFRRRMVTVMLALALDGIAITVIGLAPAGAFLLALAAIFAAGFLETMVMGLNGAIFQAIIPPEMQGRVFSLLISIGHAMSPLGLAIAGPTADALGVRFWLLLAGVAITAMSVGAFFVPAIMRIEDRAAFDAHATGAIRP